MKKLSFVILIILGLVFPASGFTVDMSKGQIVYVPSSRVDISNATFNQFSSTRLVIRNIDPNKSITLNSVDFYTPDGTIVTEYLIEPMELLPFTSVTFPASGPLFAVNGGRPFFLVDWESSRRVVEPIIEGYIVITRTPVAGGGSSINSLTLVPGKVIEGR